METNQKKNLSTGLHWLRPIHWHQSNGRITISHVPLIEGYRQVHRTFIEFSEDLNSYLRSILATSHAIQCSNTLETIKNHWILCEIGSAANPKFVNLVRVLESQNEKPILTNNPHQFATKSPEKEGGQND